MRFAADRQGFHQRVNARGFPHARWTQRHHAVTNALSFVKLNEEKSSAHRNGKRTFYLNQFQNPRRMTNQTGRLRLFVDRCFQRRVSFFFQLDVREQIVDQR